MMRILTWNINGIRACKQPLKNELFDLASDIVCLQETKITRDLLDEETAIQDGYNSYFSFSKKRSGYSGVATYCKTHATPVGVEEGLSGILTDNVKGGETIGHYGDLSEFTNEELTSLEIEGRAILTEHQYRDSCGIIKRLVVINVYCPRADPDREGRLQYKLQFYKLLQIRAEALLQANKTVIILGDFNVSHKPIDHCDPNTDDEKYYAKPSRRWLGHLLIETSLSDFSKLRASQKEKRHFVDTFRFFHPKQEDAFTCWSTVTGARQTNYGTRIDYIVSDVKLCQDEFEDCEILQNFEGSDHCPVRASLKGTVKPSDKLPSFCTKFMPEFHGRQQKLSSFFMRGTEMDKSSENIVERVKDKPFLGKRLQTMSEYEPFSKKSKSDKKSKNVKSVSITSFFKKVPSSFSHGLLGETTHRSKHLHDAEQVTKVSTANVIKEAPQSDESKESSPPIINKALKCNSTDTNDITSACGLEDGEKTSINKAKRQVASSWKDILKGPPAPPLCKGHKEPCVLRTVRKPGPNLGKQFHVCCKPQGHRSNPDARCSHFEWVSSLKKIK